MVKVELTPEECHQICEHMFYEPNRLLQMIEKKEDEIAKYEKEKQRALPRRTKTLDSWIQEEERMIKECKDEIKIANGLMEKLKDHTTEDSRWRRI